MSEECVLKILTQLLNTLLMPGAKISDVNVNRLVKTITGMPGKSSI